MKTAAKADALHNMENSIYLSEEQRCSFLWAVVSGQQFFVDNEKWRIFILIIELHYYKTKRYYVYFYKT